MPDGWMHAYLSAYPRCARAGSQVMLTRMAADYEPPSMSLLVRPETKGTPLTVQYAAPPDPRTWWKHCGRFGVGRNYDVPPHTGITVTKHFAEVSVRGYTLCLVWL